jgi:hypothetical protein
MLQKVFIGKWRVDMKRNIVMVAVMAIIVIITSVLPAVADGIEGYWCRNVNNNVADVISITRSGDVFKVNLREGWNQPIYAEGIGSLNGNRFTVTLHRTKPDAIIHTIMTFSGDSLSYTSFNMDSSFRWKGDYYRCKK